MKKYNIIFVFSLICSGIWGQNFLFSPDTIFRTLPLDVYSIDQIDITPLYTNDTAYLSYRLIENSCPPEWEFVLCDWSDCFTNMPNTDDMHPLPDGYNALIKISAHPHQTEGSGFLHFWIFPTGSMELHESIYFYYNTPNAAGIQELGKSQIHHEWINDQLLIREAPIGPWSLVDMSGRVLQKGVSTSDKISISHTGLKDRVHFVVWPNSGQMLKVCPSY